MIRKLLLWSPFLIIVGLLAAFLLGLLRPDDQLVASQLVGKPLPAFAAVEAVPGQPGIATGDFKGGKPRLLNIFASWCAPCRAEAPMLMELKARGVEIDGIAVHDRESDLTLFLAQNGNPYTRLGLDQDGRAQLAFGSSGVPETYVINERGEIIHQHVGAITPDDIEALLALLRGRS